MRNWCCDHCPPPLFFCSLPRKFTMTALFCLISLILAAGEPIALTVQKPPVQPEPHYSRIASRFARKFPRQHLTHNLLDDPISSRAWTNYLSALDYDRLYFLADDLHQFRKQEFKLDDTLKEGNLDFPYQVFSIFKERVRERCEYVDKLLEQGFDLNKNESFKWDRKHAAWPNDKAEQNELWRKKIKNEYIRRVISLELKQEEELKQDSKKDTNDQDSEDVAPNDKLLPPEEFIQKRYRQFLTVLDDSDSEWVLEKYLSAISHAYDPHSDYMSPSTVEDFDIQMRLSLVGIGALLKSEDGMARIVRIIPGGPADGDKREKRLKPGDKIIAVAQDDGPPEDILHWPLSKAVRKIRGKKGTRVVLTVIPASDPTESTTKTVDLIRDQVKLEDQAAKLEIEESTGNDGITRKLAVVTLPAFYANVKDRARRGPQPRSSVYDVEQILQKAQEQDIDGVLLDLRNNGGGYLPEAIAMTGLFIETGPAVQVREQNGSLTILPDTNPSVAYAGPLVVLVNRLSASASEIVAGALQDYGRALIVGDSKTHGKGTVQALLGLSSDTSLGSIKVTSAIYFRISGASTQLKGITPDIVIPSPFDYMQFGEDSLPNPVAWSSDTAADYLPVADLYPFMSSIKAQSDKRMADDPRFKTYDEFLQLVDKINKTEHFPLNIDERKKLARLEKRLSELEEEIEPDILSEDESEDVEKPDLVLNESLKILADLATLQGKNTLNLKQPPDANNKSFWQSISDWITE
jgi:carboxyl-terminal processing protease